MSLPVVVVGDKNQSIDIDTVELNSVEAGELIARHLLNFGHKKMAFITTPLSKNNLPRMRRLEGVRSEVEAAGGELVVVESDKKLTTHKYQPNLEYHVGYELTKSVLKDRSITAYIGVNDMVAYGILDALEEAGLSVPEECSVCGFDNIFPSRFRRVALTTIDSFLMEKGKAAFELLARKISQEKEDNNGCRISTNRLDCQRFHRTLCSLDAVSFIPKAQGFYDQGTWGETAGLTQNGSNDSVIVGREVFYAARDL